MISSEEKKNRNQLEPVISVALNLYSEGKDIKAFDSINLHNSVSRGFFLEHYNLSLFTSKLSGLLFDTCTYCLLQRPYNVI